MKLIHLFMLTKKYYYKSNSYILFLYLVWNGKKHDFISFLDEFIFLMNFSRIDFVSIVNELYYLETI